MFSEQCKIYFENKQYTAIDLYKLTSAKHEHIVSELKKKPTQQ